MAISKGALEEMVLCILCFSERASIIAPKITANLFSNRTHRKIAEAALAHVNKFGLPPGGTLEYLLEGDLHKGEEGKLLGQTMEFLSKQADQVSPDFVIGELNKFIEHQTLSNSLQLAMDALHDGDIDRAKEAVYSSVKLSNTDDGEGIWLSDSKGMLSSMDEERHEFFSSGIKALDESGVTLARKTLSFMIAPAKAGKSWYLIEVGKAGLQHHHSVLHITNELSQELVARRYLQSIFALTKSAAQKIRTPFFESVEGHTQIKFHESIRESIIDQKDKIRKRLDQAKSFPPLLIKEFPTGYLSTDELLIYLERLDREHGFRPDIIIIDYADLMKIDSAALRVDTGRLYRDLRGIAGVRNAAMVTATQGNRESSKARVVDVNMVSEDWSKIGTGDLVLTYSRTQEEKLIGLARVMVAASRDSEDRITTLISQSYPTGQFALDSVRMSADLSNEVQNNLPTRPVTGQG